jgi:adenylate cyclase class IV
MKRKYSKVYEYEGSHFRYNYERCLLEYVSLEDVDIDDRNEIVVTKRETPEVIDSIGLSKENWKDNPEYWIEEYSDQITEECHYLAQEFM